MKASEFRELSVEDLRSKVEQLEENHFRLACNKTIGQLEDTSAIKHAKKDVARAKTVLKEKELQTNV